jgi:lipoprotein NlpI
MPRWAIRCAVPSCDEAVGSYTEALDRVDTDQSRYWFLFYTRAICYHLTDNWPPAEADFRKALELNPGQPQVLNYLGYSLVEQRGTSTRRST